MNCSGTSFPWCNASSYWSQLEECLGSGNHIWTLALGQWSKIFLCSLVFVMLDLLDSFHA